MFSGLDARSPATKNQPSGSGSQNRFVFYTCALECTHIPEQRLKRPSLPGHGSNAQGLTHSCCLTSLQNTARPVSTKGSWSLRGRQRSSSTTQRQCLQKVPQGSRGRSGEPRMPPLTTAAAPGHTGHPTRTHSLLAEVSRDGGALPLPRLQP